jgi:serine protease Do
MGHPHVTGAYVPEGQISLGVMVQSIPFDRLDDMGLSHGVRVRSVIPGGAAEAAGVHRGDVITALNGEEAYSPERLQWLVQHVKSPERITLDLRRDGKTLNLQVDASQSAQSSIPQTGSVWKGPKQAYLGIGMQGLTQDLRKRFGVKDDRGVLVNKVMRNGPAAEAGIRAGDVIVGIGRKAVRDTGDVYRAMRYFDSGDSIDLHIVRDSQAKTLTVTLGGVSPSWLQGYYNPDMPMPNWPNWTRSWPDAQDYAWGPQPGLPDLWTELPSWRPLGQGGRQI